METLLFFERRATDFLGQGKRNGSYLLEPRVGKGKPLLSSPEPREAAERDVGMRDTANQRGN